MGPLTCVASAESSATKATRPLDIGVRAHGSSMPATVVTVLTWLVGAVAPLAAAAGDDPVRLPPHDYVVVDPTAAAKPARLLAGVREALLRAITEADLAEPGYPRACHVIRTPDPRRPGWFDVACVADAGDPAQSDGILFDSSGRYLQLSVVDFPDSRPYLMEIFVVPRSSDPRLRTEERWSVPRVAVHFPQVARSWHPEIWSALDRGVRSLGATVLEK